MQVEYERMTVEQISEIESIGYMTAYNIFVQYGISKQKTIRALHSGKLNGFMKSFFDNRGKERLVVKWYIIKDSLFLSYIADNKK